jgi:hypothetical protein
MKIPKYQPRSWFEASGLISCGVGSSKSQECNGDSGKHLETASYKLATEAFQIGSGRKGSGKAENGLPVIEFAF